MLKVYPENMVDRMVEELKRTDMPIFIWGGEKLAEKIKIFLDKAGIQIEGFLLSRKFWDINIKELYSNPIYVMEDYLPEHRCNIIVAFAGYRDDLFEKIDKTVCKLYVLDFIGKLVLDNFDGSISDDFIQKNYEKFKWLENHLADEASKRALEEYIYQRMSGTYCKEYYELEQYFPEGIIQLCEGEIFVDCGAYHGESVLDFMRNLDKQNIKGYRKIISIEAENDNIKKLRKALKEYKNLEIVPVGVWNENTKLYISNGKEDNSQIIEEGDESIEVRTIDEILAAGEATYIKMDIEGSELEALQGAQETIRNYKPKLAICIYHKVDDLIEIPEYIYYLRPDYKFYIRNHSPYGIETVLYAV